jgi:hypothetical protein
MKNLIIPLMGVFLAGCFGLGSGRLTTPVEAAVEALPRDAREFKGYGVETAPNGNVGVVYSYRLPVRDNPGWVEHVFVYVEVERKNLFEWERVHTCYAPTERLTGVVLPYEYRMNQNGCSVLFGQIYSQEIKAVEVRFSNGESVKKSTQNDFFLIFIPDEVDVCELRLLGEEDLILDEKSTDRGLPWRFQCRKKS